MSVLDRSVFASREQSTWGLAKALGMTAILALVALAILLPVMQSSDEATQGYRIHALQQQQLDLEAEIYNTQSQIAELGSESRIQTQARDRLGMIPADRIINVSVDVPAPVTHDLPNQYLPTTDTTVQKAPDSLTAKILHLFRLR
jgi:cell division protein FtsL